MEHICRCACWRNVQHLFRSMPVVSAQRALGCVLLGAMTERIHVIRFKSHYRSYQEDNFASVAESCTSH